MSEQEVRDFLAQFDRARDDFKTWPQWMQDAAVERAATFPRTTEPGKPVISISDCCPRCLRDGIVERTEDCKRHGTAGVKGHGDAC